MAVAALVAAAVASMRRPARTPPVPFVELLADIVQREPVELDVPRIRSHSSIQIHHEPLQLCPNQTRRCV